MEMTYAEAAEVLSRDDVSPRAREEAIEVALRALEEVEIQGQIIVNLNRDLKAMRKAMNGQSEYAYLGGDLISREALRERAEMINWYSTNDRGVLHSGAADEESAYIRYADMVAVVEGALAVDAVEVVHGRWLYDSESDKYFCSACSGNAFECKRVYLDNSTLNEVVFSDYCPNCGAKMDGGNEDA